MTLEEALEMKEAMIHTAKAMKILKKLKLRPDLWERLDGVNCELFGETCFMEGVWDSEIAAINWSR